MLLKIPGDNQITSIKIFKPGPLFCWLLIVALSSWLVLGHRIWRPLSAACATGPFDQIQIEEPFRDVLISNPEFMRQGGARFLELKDGGRALVGIGKAFQEPQQPIAVQKLRRIGEIRARAAVLELAEGMDVSTSKISRQASFSGRPGKRGNMLSSFFQVTQTQVQASIQQLPVVGTWWSPGHKIFYVAVGMVKGGMGYEKMINSKRISKDDSFVILEGQEPYLSLLRASPVLSHNGGVRAFIMEGNRKVLIAVGSAQLKDSLMKARRIARLKAIRALLEQRKKIRLSSVERLSDQEMLIVTNKGEQHILLSKFLSVQEERVSGIVQALPVVVVWKRPSQKVVSVAIGKLVQEGP